MHLMLCLSTLSTLVFALNQYQISLVSTVSTIPKAFHPVFEMFYSNLYRQCQHKPFLCSLSSKVQHQYRMSLVSTVSGQSSDRRLFIQYLKCSTQICINSVDISPFFALCLQWYKINTGKPSLLAGARGHFMLSFHTS